MPRAHYYGIAQDSAGNALENSVVRVLQPGTTTFIADPIYASDTDVAAMGNPFTTETGVISIYLDTPQRIRLGITPPSAVEQFVEDIDVGLAGGGGGDSDHVGTGSGSTQVGLSAASGGTNSVALGQTAASAGNSAVALGYAASGSGLNATAVGHSAVAAGERGAALGQASAASAVASTALGHASAASALGATAVGDSAVGNSTRATALGSNATAGHDHAAALGSETATTEPNQIMLGTASDFAEAPGSYVLTAVDGKRGRLRMLPDGSLTTIWHVPTNAANLLSTAESTFETSIGGWAAVSGLSGAVQSADYAAAGTKSMKLTLSGAGAASARSSRVATTAGAVHVGQARMFYHAGAMTGGVNGTCWLEFYDGSDVIIGTATAGRTRAFFADAWIYFDVRALSPAGTATVALRVGLPTGGAVNGDIFYADQCLIATVAGTV